MKENGSMTSKMINRNWVLKRKRRKLPCGPDLSNGKEGTSIASESTGNTSSAKRRLKGEASSDRSALKKKGNDGVSCFSQLAFLIYFCWIFGCAVSWTSMLNIVLIWTLATKLYMVVPFKFPIQILLPVLLLLQYWLWLACFNYSWLVIFLIISFSSTTLNAWSVILVEICCVVTAVLEPIISSVSIHLLRYVHFSSLTCSWPL